MRCGPATPSAQTLYLYCFRQGLESRPGVFARHYLGFTRDLEQRDAEHRAGSGSPLLRAALAAGLEVTIVRLWPGGDRKLERRLKKTKNLPRYCPICNPELNEAAERIGQKGL